MAAKWAQKTVVLPPHKRGCHLVTSKILKDIEQELSEFKCGLAHFFLQHTSASLTINENYDSDVQIDTETFLSRIVPEGRFAPWKHTLEGPDDMPAHIKSSMFGCNLTVPMTDGRLNLGTWQKTRGLTRRSANFVYHSRPSTQQDQIENTRTYQEISQLRIPLSFKHANYEI